MFNITELARRFDLLSPRRRLEWYPPFRSMRVRVLEYAEEQYAVRILLPLSRRTRNPGGCMFGGCMAALADPVPALICARAFPGYAVWTRSLEIDFVREGRSDLELRFALEPAQRDEIGQMLERQGRCNPWFEYAYFDRQGHCCARIRNRVAIRRLGAQASGGALIARK